MIKPKQICKSLKIFLCAIIPVCSMPLPKYFSLSCTVSSPSFPAVYISVLNFFMECFAPTTLSRNTFYFFPMANASPPISQHLSANKRTETQ